MDRLGFDPRHFRLFDPRFFPFRPHRRKIPKPRRRLLQWYNGNVTSADNWDRRVAWDWRSEMERGFPAERDTGDKMSFPAWARSPNSLPESHYARMIIDGHHFELIDFYYDQTHIKQIWSDWKVWPPFFLKEILNSKNLPVWPHCDCWYQISSFG